MSRYRGLTTGIRRPPHVFFFEIDSFDFRRLNKYCLKYLKYFSIYKTQHGYHVIGYLFTKKIWRIFKRAFKTDYTMRIKKRFLWKTQILRIAPKYEYFSGEKYSERPELVYGNFFLINYQDYKIVYRCK